MEVADEFTRGLDLLKESKFSDEAFDALTKLAFSILVGESSETQLSECKPLAGLDPSICKQAYASLIVLGLQFAKLNADGDQVVEYLKEAGVPEARVNSFTTEYKRRSIVIRNRLSDTSFRFSHVIDVQWRCDLMVKSNSQERLNVATFFIKLKVIDDTGQIKDVQFTCTQDQLQDLVGTLHDATMSLERLDLEKSEQ